MPEGTSIGKINDLAFRIVLIPVFGIIIPIITKMTAGKDLSHWMLKLAYLYTIGIAFIIWQGNRYLWFSLNSYFNWFNKPVKRLVALVLSICLFTVPLSIVLHIGWYNLFNNGVIEWHVVYFSTSIILVCVVFIAHTYETVFLVKISESEKIRNEKLERAKSEAELEALKSQVDPHFIFNSLNTLSYLIETKKDKALEFNDNLADVYRYLLQNKERNFIPLNEEIDFLVKYFSLLKIRFEGAIQLNVAVEEAKAEQFYIPPISLQLLAENAIKHNEFSSRHPLTIDIALDGEELKIVNNASKKEIMKKTSKIGLSNLHNRYKLLMDKDIIISQTEKEFTVILPLLKVG